MRDSRTGTYGVIALVLALTASGAGAAVVADLAQYHLQGQTGDVLGAGQQAAEVLGLIALAAPLASTAWVCCARGCRRGRLAAPRGSD